MIGPRAMPVLLACALMRVAIAVRAEPFDLVIAGGRVMDPESGLDAVLNVGVRAGKVEALSAQPMEGVRRIDAQGLVVAPGFRRCAR